MVHALTIHRTDPVYIYVAKIDKTAQILYRTCTRYALPFPRVWTLQGMKVTGEVDPERVGGQVYPSLVALLKASSQHFNTNIAKQVQNVYSHLSKS